MKIPEKISNSTESASLEFTPFPRRSIISTLHAASKVKRL